MFPEDRNNTCSLVRSWDSTKVWRRAQFVRSFCHFIPHVCSSILVVSSLHGIKVRERVSSDNKTGADPETVAEMPRKWNLHGHLQWPSFNVPPTGPAIAKNPYIVISTVSLSLSILLSTRWICRSASCDTTFFQQRTTSCKSFKLRDYICWCDRRNSWNCCCRYGYCEQCSLCATMLC